jgi:hypothetical protein
MSKGIIHASGSYGQGIIHELGSVSTYVQELTNCKSMYTDTSMCISKINIKICNCTINGETYMTVPGELYFHVSMDIYSFKTTHLYISIKIFS